MERMERKIMLKMIMNKSHIGWKKREGKEKYSLTVRKKT